MEKKIKVRVYGRYCTSISVCSAVLFPPSLMHFSFSCFQLIYVARNPRDVCVSYFNHWKILEGYHGTFEVFVKAFLDDVCGYYTPFLDHVKDYWELQKTNKNVLFVFYEDMKKDLPSVIRRVSAFLERPVSEDDVSVLASHLSFDRMKNNSSVNKRELVAVSVMSVWKKPG